MNDEQRPEVDERVPVDFYCTRDPEHPLMYLSTSAGRESEQTVSTLYNSDIGFAVNVDYLPGDVLAGIEIVSFDLYLPKESPLVSEAGENGWVQLMAAGNVLFFTVPTSRARSEAGSVTELGRPGSELRVQCVFDPAGRLSHMVFPAPVAPAD